MRRRRTAIFMPFCPKCGYEYQDPVKVCPDCGVRLVGQLRPVRKAPVQEELVTVATFMGPEAAYAAAAKLETEGIWSFVADENILMYMGGTVRLQVRERDARRAEEILGL